MIYPLRISWQNRVLVDLDRFELKEGALNFLFGESGIGKTLVAKTLYGILDQQEWQISITDKDYRDYLASPDLRSIQSNGYFVFQEPSTHLDPLSAIDNHLQLPAENFSGPAQNIISRFFSESEQRQIFRLYPQPFRPSGGEKQRLFLVKSFLKITEWIRQADSGTALFIWDEPAAHLDMFHRNLFYQTLTELHRHKPFTGLVITHDYSVILKMENEFPDQRQDIRYLELTKNEDAIRCRSFEPDAFLEWHRTIHPSAHPASGEEILTVEPGFSIFGCRYGFRNFLKKDAPFVIPRNTIVYLKAPSGYGKTLFAKSLCGLIRVTGMNMKFDGIPINDHSPAELWQNNLWGKKLVMVFQHADESLNPDAPVISHFRGLPLKKPLSEIRIIKMFNTLFRESLDKEFLKKPVKHLSGGQKQKVNLFRALLLRPDLLILDEPFNGLDFLSLQNALHLLNDTLVSGTSVMVISHDEDLIEKIIPEQNIYYLIRLNGNL